jgi:hypothetical protein
LTPHRTASPVPHPSRIARREKPVTAEELITESGDAGEEAEQPPLSRREFLRKVMPNR